jgi:hypothetical protein
MSDKKRVGNDVEIAGESLALKTNALARDRVATNNAPAETLYSDQIHFAAPSQACANLIDHTVGNIDAAGSTSLSGSLIDPGTLGAHTGIGSDDATTSVMM